MALTVDTTGAVRKLQGVEKQAAYAASGALYDGAVAGQKAMRAGYEGAFTLRNAFTVREGAKLLRKPTKTDLVAEIGASEKASYLAKHVAGGSVGPADGRGRIAVPTGAVRRTKRDLIPASQRPRSLLAKGGFFRGPKSGTSAIAKAVGRGKARTAMAFYLLVGRITVKPTLKGVLADAAEQGRKTIIARFPERFAAAMRTAK